MDDDPNKGGGCGGHGHVCLTRVIITQDRTKMGPGLWVRLLPVMDSPLHSSLYAWHSHMWFSKMTNYILLWTFVYVECSEVHPWGTLLGRTEDLYSYLSSVQSLSRVWLFVSPWPSARQASLSVTNSQSLLKLMSIESVMPSNRLILCHPLLLLPSIFPSIRVFSNELVLHIRYWSFSFNISTSNGYSGLISFRMDWLDLLAVQGTLKSLLQHHSSKASVLQRSAFFIVQLSHPYMTTGKTIVLTRQTFVGKVMSLLFSMLSRLVITFLPRSKHLLILIVTSGWHYSNCSLLRGKVVWVFYSWIRAALHLHLFHLFMLQVVLSFAERDPWLKHVRKYFYWWVVI